MGYSLIQLGNYNRSKIEEMLISNGEGYMYSWHIIRSHIRSHVKSSSSTRPIKFKPEIDQLWDNCQVIIINSIN